MYHEIQLMLREGLSQAAVSKTTGLHKRTVRKYAAMSEPEYEALLMKKESRAKLLAHYETFVKDRFRNLLDSYFLYL